jgi:hypothetical protein
MESLTLDYIASSKGGFKLGVSRISSGVRDVRCGVSRIAFGVKSKAVRAYEESGVSEAVSGLASSTVRVYDDLSSRPRVRATVSRVKFGLRVINPGTYLCFVRDAIEKGEDDKIDYAYAFRGAIWASAVIASFCAFTFSFTPPIQPTRFDESRIEVGGAREIEDDRKIGYESREESYREF